MSDSLRVLIGGEPESVYRSGDEIIISGHMRLYADEALGLAVALLKAYSTWKADDE